MSDFSGELDAFRAGNTVVRYAMQYPEGPSRRNSHSFVAAFFVNMTNFVGHLSGMFFPVFCFPLHPATLRRCPEQQRVFS